MSCPSCCNSCSQGDRSSKRSKCNPNLLPVGSLFLKLNEPHALLCDHTRHAPDGWHKFQQSIKPHLVSELLGEQICHLVTDRYIEATYRNRPTDGGVIVRVYVVVKVVQGEGLYKGPSREFQQKQAARRRTQGYLEQVLTTLTNTKELWDALEGSGEVSSLVPKVGYSYIISVTDLNITLGWSSLGSNLQRTTFSKSRSCTGVRWDFNPSIGV
jgi:hypothetical protein